MSDTTSNVSGLGLPNASPIATGAGSTASRTANAVSGAAFQALLEKLDVQARELAADSTRVASPADLAQAVDRAHASLQDALALSDRLLEAYRASIQNGNGSPTT